jgi:hypothetical protein
LGGHRSYRKQINERGDPAYIGYGEFVIAYASKPPDGLCGVLMGTGSLSFEEVDQDGNTAKLSDWSEAR